MSTLQDEKILIEKAVNGDESSFEALILSCKGKAYNLAFRYLKNEQDALDALQESFIKIYRHLGKFNGESRFDTWVYRIVANTCNDVLRKNKKHQEYSQTMTNDDDEEFEIEVEDNGPGPEKLYEQKEEAAYILECMELLSHEQKEVIILRDIQGFDYKEISEILQCSVGTVKSRISRSRSKLKDIYLNHRL